VLDKKQLVVVPDIERYHGRRAVSLQREAICSLLHVPLVASSRALGSMCVGTRAAHTFDSDELDLLSAIGSQVAVAIDNARLYAEVQRKEFVRGELFKKAIDAQEDERKRIARELHDDTSQALTALLYAVERGLEGDCAEAARADLAGMHQLVQRTLDGVHKVIFDLRPTMLDHLGLVPAVRWLAQSRLEAKAIRVVVEAPAEPPRLPPQVETALFRVVQEAITNVARHSGARNARLVLSFSPGHVSVLAEDDGVGFDVLALDLSPDSQRGLGLIGMRERVELLGGRVSLDTAPGCGTRLQIEVPLDERRQVG
jgi:signal transduction histidine kinase